MKKQINIIGISGSLKSASANTNILQAIAAIVPPQVDFRIFEGIDILPHFNPERTENNDAVEAFRAQIKKSDAVIISTPEYAFGVPGVLKNALDWLVSSGEMNEKPVASISASPLYSGGDKALASLLLTLTALGTNIGADSSVSIGNIKNKVNAAGAVTDKDTIHTLTMLLEKLLEKISSEQNLQASYNKK